MYQYSLQLPTKSLMISINGKINEKQLTKILADIQQIINNLMEDLDPIEPRSGISLLQTITTDDQISLSPTMISFIKTNIEMANITNRMCSAFSETPDWEIKQHTLEKHNLVKFNPHLLLTAFVINLVVSELKHHRIRDFLLECNEYAYGAGDQTIEMENPAEVTPLNISLQNSAAYLKSTTSEPASIEKIALANPFSPATQQNRAGILVIHQDIILARDLAELAIELHHPYQLKKFCQTWKCQLLDIDLSGEIHQYA